MALGAEGAVEEGAAAGVEEEESLEDAGAGLSEDFFESVFDSDLESDLESEEDSVELESELPELLGA